MGPFELGWAYQFIVFIFLNFFLNLSLIKLYVLMYGIKKFKFEVKHLLWILEDQKPVK